MSARRESSPATTAAPSTLPRSSSRAVRVIIMRHFHSMPVETLNDHQPGFEERRRRGTRARRKGTGDSGGGKGGARRKIFGVPFLLFDKSASAVASGAWEYVRESVSSSPLTQQAQQQQQQGVELVTSRAREQRPTTATGEHADSQHAG